jgi:hypothetical protein
MSQQDPPVILSASRKPQNGGESGGKYLRNRMGAILKNILITLARIPKLRNASTVALTIATSQL